MMEGPGNPSPTVLSLVDALKQARGPVAEITQVLGSTERIIRYKLRKYGIKPGRYS